MLLYPVHSQIDRVFIAANKKPLIDWSQLGGGESEIIALVIIVIR